MYPLLDFLIPKCNVIETRKEEEDEKKGGHEDGEGRENK